MPTPGSDVQSSTFVLRTTWSPKIHEQMLDRQWIQDTYQTHSTWLKIINPAKEPQTVLRRTCTVKNS